MKGSATRRRVLHDGLPVTVLILASVVLVSLIAIVAIVALSISRARLGKILLYLVSFAAGGLLGDAFLHLLPEAVHEYGFGVNVSLAVLAGIVVAFTVEKFIHWHHHEVNHEHAHEHRPQPFAFMILFGDFVHNFIDGMIIAGSYLVSIPAGVATTLAVIVHEIPQEIGDFGVLLHAGFSRAKAILYNFLSALGALAGAGIGILAAGGIDGFLEVLIPFAVGNFVYVAGSDLLPELRKVTDARASVGQIVALLLGIGVMVGLLALEGDEHAEEEHVDEGDEHAAGGADGGGNATASFLAPADVRALPESPRVAGA